MTAPHKLANSPINKPIDPADYVYIFSLAHPCGGETVYLDRDELDQYNRDPDAFAAQHFGFQTADDYREWIRCRGTALCSERTRSGHLCCNPNGGGSQLDPAIWRERHRAASCSIHAGAVS